MERLCFTLRIRPGMEAEYDRRHAAIEPAFEDEMRATGVSDYTIFRRGPDVIGVLTCTPDVATVIRRGAEAPGGKAWAEAMIEVLEPAPDGLERYVEVWRLD